MPFSSGSLYRVEVDFNLRPPWTLEGDPAWGSQSGEGRRHQRPKGRCTHLLNCIHEWEEGGGFMTPLQNSTVKTGDTAPGLPPYRKLC